MTSRSPRARAVILLLLWRCLPLCAYAQNAMIISHNDISRTGWNPNETYLAPSNVGTSGFGRLFSQAVDGQVYAQPLYVPRVSIAGGTHNVVYVCTEHESVYAFDADTNQAALWQVNFGGVAGGTTVTSVPYAETASCNDIGTEFGITDTPAIDLSTRTLYLVAETKEVPPGGAVTNYVQRLHALDLSTGAEKFGGPVTIQAAVTVSHSIAVFDAAQELNRPGLVLLNGIVYTFWGSHCDDGLYYGWVLGYGASNLSLQKIFNAAPVTQQAAIWASGVSPPLDSNGNFYLTTANATFDVNTGGVDYGDCVLKLSSASMAVGDYFSPANQAYLASQDEDFGACGAVLLPNSLGTTAHPHLLTCADKTGVIYLMDRDNLGGYLQGPGGTDGVLQEFQSASITVFSGYTTPACFQNTLYWGFGGDPIRAYNLANGQYNTTPSSLTPESYGFPGAMPSGSSNGDTNGILWAVLPGTTATLLAYDATNLANELYSSNNVAADNIAYANNKFTPPTVINGKVYVGTAGSLEVFGLTIAATPFPTPTSIGTATATPTASPTATPTAPKATSTATATLSPTHSPSTGSGPVVAFPNVLKNGQFVATFQAPEAGASLDVSIYDMVGEKMVEGAGVPGTSLCYWDSTGAASGFYLAYVKVTDPDGSIRTQTVKLVVIH